MTSLQEALKAAHWQASPRMQLEIVARAAAGEGGPPAARRAVVEWIQDNPPAVATLLEAIFGADWQDRLAGIFVQRLLSADTAAVTPPPAAAPSQPPAENQACFDRRGGDRRGRGPAPPRGPHMGQSAGLRGWLAETTLLGKPWGACTREDLKALLTKGRRIAFLAAKLLDRVPPDGTVADHVSAEEVAAIDAAWKTEQRG